MAFWKIDLSRSAASTLSPRLLFLPRIKLSNLLAQNSLPSLSLRPSNVAAAVPARDVFHATRRPFLVAKWRPTISLFDTCFFLDITTPLPDGPLFSICVEATMSSFRPGGYHLTSIILSTGILVLALVVQSAILEMALLRTSWCRCAWLGRWPRRDAVVFGCMGGDWKR